MGSLGVAGDTAIIFESQSEDWSDYSPTPYLASYSPERFAMLAYSVPDADTACAQIELAHQRGISRVYLTDDSLPNPWDSLPSFWSEQLTCIERINSCALWLPLVIK